MRNLSELNINKKGKPIGHPSPTNGTIREFQSHFGVILPEDYIELLRHSNGGHPEVDSIQPIGRPEAARWAVNRFYHLDDDKNSTASLWAVTENWRTILGEKTIPFATDGGGNQFFLDLKTSPPSVKLCVHDDKFSIVEIAPSFWAFIDALSVDPDMI
jgi:hypothetical protein